MMAKTTRQAEETTNWTDFLSSSVQALRLNDRGDGEEDNGNIAWWTKPETTTFGSITSTTPDVQKMAKPDTWNPASPTVEKMTAAIQPPPRLARWSWDCQDSTTTAGNGDRGAAALEEHHLPKRHYSLDLSKENEAPQPSPLLGLSSRMQQFTSPLMQSRTWSLNPSVTNQVAHLEPLDKSPTWMSSPEPQTTAAGGGGPLGFLLSNPEAELTSLDDEPTFPFNKEQQQDWFYEVAFKRYRRSVLCGPSSFRVGDYVKVEADRGQDLGHIVRVSRDLDSLRLEIRQSGDPTIDKRLVLPLKRIMCLATESELNSLAQKFEEEHEILDLCRSKVRQRALPMKVVDAEFQFDRHKLTFYFTADRRIDFRELVRDLFAVYKTRIWMQQITDNQITC